MPEDLERILAELGEAARRGDAEAVEARVAELLNTMATTALDEPAQFVENFKRVVNEEGIDTIERSRRVNELCETLVANVRKRAEPYPVKEAKLVLDTLRRKRHYGAMVKIAEVFLQTGQNAPGVRRLYAQALLERGQVSAALCVLEVLKAECETEGGDREELKEAIGLIGRVHKQIYIESAASGGTREHGKQSLEQAVANYAQPFVEDESNIWHGINAVALLERAKRDGIDLGKAPMDAKKAAETILSGIAAMKEPDLWDCSTAGEACLALGDYAGALEWIAKYTAGEGSDAFEFASTLRQFEEVWNLEDSNPEHARILNALRSAVIEREGGSVSLANPAEGIAGANELLEDKAYEAVLGNDRYQKYKLMVKGLNQARIVAKIETRAGNGHGTGFLFPGAVVHESITDEWVLITNAHVISLDPVEQGGSPGAIPPDEAQVRFETWDNPDEVFRLGEILFTSPRTELDCSIVTLKPLPSFVHDFDIPKRLPRADGRQRVYVIGHPRGEALSVSLNDNVLLDHEAPKLHYRAPTEGGSSGSPVFSSAWDLIGLHHAGGTEMKMLNGKQGTYPANEGIWIHAVLKAAAAALE